MPTFTTSNPVAINRATKVEHYDAVFDNTQILRTGGIAIASQAADDFIFASSSTQLARLAAAAGLPYYTGSTWKIKPAAKPDLTISSNTLVVDLDGGAGSEVFRFTLDANITTMTINNIPASGKVGAFVLVMTANGSPFTWAWLTSTVKWPGGVAPTMTQTNNKADIFSFFTYDGGSTWIGSVIGQVYL